MEESWNQIASISWLIPGLPLFTFVLVGLGRKWLGEALSGWVATLSVMSSAILAGMTAWTYFSYLWPGVYPGCHTRNC